MVLYDFKRIFKNWSCSASVEYTVKTADFIEILTHSNVFFLELHTTNTGESWWDLGLSTLMLFHQWKLY